MPHSFSSSEAAAPSLRDKVRFLSSPAAYAERPARVEVKQTHMSWLFLTDTTVYKLKKPVVYSFLDFGTVQARERNCRAEVQLNRRLAPTVYLGLNGLQRQADGQLVLADDAATDGVVDWLVRMRRLPEELTLEHLIHESRLTARHLATMGTLLAAFYGHLAPSEVTVAEHLARMKAQHALNVDALKASPLVLDPVKLARVLGAVQQFIESEPVLAARVGTGRVVEGHGDLRPEHVFLTQPPVVIDCLEFNRTLRLVDWVDEIAFLGLECARLGAVVLGPALRAQMEGLLADPVPDRLFHFYTAFRACVRARLALAHLQEPAPPTPAKWPLLAQTYVDLADAAVTRMRAAP